MVLKFANRAKAADALKALKIKGFDPTGWTLTVGPDGYYLSLSPGERAEEAIGICWAAVRWVSLPIPKPWKELYSDTGIWSFRKWARRDYGKTK